METETVAVFGAGRSGIAAANFLARRGARVRLTDSSRADQLPELARLEASAERYLGSHPPEILDELDYIVLSPGIPASIDVLREARQRGIPVISEIELAFRHLRGRVVGVTGSNGKSTTTALIGHLLECAGMEPVVAGNIGTPLTAAVDVGSERIYVVELSSFQLETVDQFRADIGLLLNVTPDHMDRYASFEEYAAAKYRIFSAQTDRDLAILNAEDETSLQAPTSARRWTFSIRRPVRPGAWCTGPDLTLDVGSGPVTIPRDALALPGDANLENALAAWLAVHDLGVDPTVVEQGLGTFPGLKHRMQRLGSLGGAEWINDSKGTNIEATMKSLSGLADSSVVLILGGRDKGSDFTRMRELVSRKVRLLITIGEAAGSIATALSGACEIESCEDLDHAARIASTRAAEGDSVLLSPACASYDQYRNFEERGDHFARLFEELGGVR